VKNLLLLTLFAAAACSKPEAPPIVRGALESESYGLTASPQCSRLIPLEWSASWPVPGSGSRHGLYQVFFSGRAGNPKTGFRALQPGGAASFGADGHVEECSRAPGDVSEIPGSSLELKDMTLEEIDARSRELYAATERIAASYWSGRTPGPADKAAVVEYSRLFHLLANPAHAAAYRALNPDFWSWVEKNGGAAPPAK
jgi:hypothetical protein